MFQNPVLQLQLARELDRFQPVERTAQSDAQLVESVLDAIVRRLRQLVGTRPMQPLVRGAS
jgi:hypothetical protein